MNDRRQVLLRLPEGVEDTSMNRYACLRAGTIFGYLVDHVLDWSPYEVSVSLSNGAEPGDMDWLPIYKYDEGTRVCEPCPVPGM